MSLRNVYVLQRKFSSLVCVSEFLSLHLGSCKTSNYLNRQQKLDDFFQSKSLHPALRNFMDTIIAYNLVLAHLPSQADAASDFLSRMQTDLTQLLELQFHESIPTKEIEIDMNAKAPDVSMLVIESDHPEQVEPQPHLLSEDFINIIN